MIKIKHIFTAFIAGIVISLSKGVDAVPAKLTIEEINSIAKQTTVLIAPKLTKAELADLLNRKPVARWTVGSGVIVAKQGKTYYILTVTHNFSQEQVSQNVDYGIVTNDRKVHQVKQINDRIECTNKFLEAIKNQREKTALLRFGCFENQEINGYDLAIVSFESKENYTVATLGDASKLQEEDIVYISGWPKIEAEPKLKRDGSLELDSEGKIVCKEPAPERQRRLAWGPLKASIPVSEKDNGYSLYYTDYTRPGMSGGPLFNSYGEVVGIHGRGSTNKPICGQIYEPISNNNSSSQKSSKVESDWQPFSGFESPENLPNSQDQMQQDDFQPFPGFESKNNLENDLNNNQNNSSIQESDDSSISIFELKKMYSSGQNVDFSQRLIKQLGMNLSFKLEAPSSKIIESKITKVPQIKTPNVSSQIENSQPTNTDITILENPGLIDPNQTKEGGFEDPNDQIDNIYTLFDFSLKNRIRDEGNIL